MIDFLARDNVLDGCVLLAGVADDPWGTPVYWADGGDPTYEVEVARFALPPEFAALRIPRGAQPMRARDHEMVVYDLERGFVAWLSRASFSTLSGTWSAEGGSVAYLASNGLDRETGNSDDLRNTGTQRGLNGAVVAARLDEVEGGAVEHVLRLGVHTAARASVLPMTGSDGTSAQADAPPQGTIIRLKPSVDLATFGLEPQAQVLAEALQRYGAVIGDSTGAGVELKLEATSSEGRGQLWSLQEDSLCAIPMTEFEIVGVPAPDGAAR